MGSVLTSLFIAAGISAFVYAKLGRRVGYGNSQNVWTLVGISFAMSFVVMLLLVNTFNLLD